jgi:mycothiol synthase
LGSAAVTLSGSSPSPASSRIPEWLSRLITRARAADGQPPFSDQSLVDLRIGERRLVQIDELAAALVSDTEAEMVVDPDARGRGIGTALLDRVLNTDRGDVLLWAHGDHPAARALAASHSLTAVRELLHMRADLTAETSTAGTATTSPSATDGITAFRVGTDNDDWLELNARAFVHHAEQGAVTGADLDELIGEEWFNADDFLLLRDPDGRLVGYCWLKIENGTGEFYVVGIDPARQGEGFGRRLTEAGLTRLRQRGVTDAHLYVEGDNVAAVSLYRSLGFARDAVDIQYLAPAPV